jgi:hypothetical protein
LKTDAPKAFNEDIRKKNRKIPQNSHPSLNPSPPARLKKRKHLDYEMFLPFLKIVKKTLTRWSQVTKKMKDKTHPK